MSLKKVHQTIKKYKRFLISTHVNPDPDALCSELALAAFLKSLGKTVYIVNDDKVPGRYQFLPQSKSIKSYKNKMKITTDVVIVVDCGELDRIGKVQKLIGGQETIINIDHHVTNDLFGDVNLVDIKASSTAEVLFELLMFAKYRLNQTVAQCLYLGIMTDTGSFRYENTSSRTFEIAGQLAKYNVATNQFYQRIYERIPYHDVKELAWVIHHAELLFSGKLIIVELSKKILNKFSENFDLRDAIFRFLRSIEGIEIVAILTEAGKNKTRANLRSNKSFDVAKLASHFAGGGHKRASGCMIKGPMRMAKKELIKQIGKML